MRRLQSTEITAKTRKRSSVEVRSHVSRSDVNRSAERPKKRENSLDSADSKTDFTKLNPNIERRMAEFAKRLNSVDLIGVRKEWSELATYSPSGTSIVYQYNGPKNFPGGRECLDDTRVGLHFDVPPQTDYLHANWIQSSLHSLRIRLILAQTPLDSTVYDFWRCIWQEKIRSVIMLCDKYEGGKRICAQYWPMRLNEPTAYGKLTVTFVKNETPNKETNFIKLRMSVTYKTEPQVETFIYQLKNWNDGSVPENAKTLLQIVRSVNELGRTVLIHGAAGVGRPAVMAALIIADTAFNEGKVPNIAAIVKEIRSQRKDAVANELQYVFIYRALCEYIAAKSVATANCKQFIAKFDMFRKGNTFTSAISSSLPKTPTGDVDYFSISARPSTRSAQPTASKPLVPKTPPSSPIPNGGAEYEPLNIPTSMPPPPK